MRLDAVDLRTQGSGARAPWELDVLEELVFLEQAVELTLAQKVVLPTVPLARPAFARRRGHRELEDVGHPSKQDLFECPLAGTGRAGDDDNQRVTC